MNKREETVEKRPAMTEKSVRVVYAKPQIELRTLVWFACNLYGRPGPDSGTVVPSSYFVFVQKKNLNQGRTSSKSPGVAIKNYLPMPSR